MASYSFNGGITSNLFSDINTGVVAKRLKTPDTEYSGVFSFLHNCLGLANFTNNHHDIVYTITRTPGGYELNAHWTISAIKAEALLAYAEQLMQQELAVPERPEWRVSIVTDLNGLRKRGCQPALTYEPEDGRRGQMRLQASVSLAAVTGPPPDAVVELPRQRLVPHELLAAVIHENVRAALPLYGRDHAALLALLEPLTVHDLHAAALVGFTYYLYLEQPKRAYAYLRRVADHADQLDRRLARWVLDFVGTIEFTKLAQSSPAETSLVRSLAAGNGYAVLKLAYLYLQQGSAPNREAAARLAAHGEQLLALAPSPDDPATVLDPDGLPLHDAAMKKAGYHIVACVYVWNRDLKGAARVQGRFLTDPTWCAQNESIVEGYLLLAFALGNEAFLADLITDYPVVRQQFGMLLDAWYYSEVAPEKEGFTAAMVPYVNRLRGAGRRYFGKG